MALGQHTQRQSWRTCSRNTIDRNMINSRTYFKPWEKSVQFHEMETNIALGKQYNIGVRSMSSRYVWPFNTHTLESIHKHIETNNVPQCIPKGCTMNTYLKNKTQWDENKVQKNSQIRKLEIIISFINFLCHFILWLFVVYSNIVELFFSHKFHTTTMAPQQSNAF